MNENVARQIAVDFLDNPRNVDMLDMRYWSGDYYQLGLGEVQVSKGEPVYPARMSVPEFVGGVAYALYKERQIKRGDLDLLPAVCYELGLEQSRRAVSEALNIEPL